EVFRHGGGKKAAEELGVPFLGEVPLDPAIAEAGDTGVPLLSPGGVGSDSPSGLAFRGIAERLVKQGGLVNTPTPPMHHPPEEIKVEEGAVHIKWSDGHQSRFPFRALRQACPCALCMDEWTGQRRTDPNRVLMSVRPLDIRRVGRYGIQFSWSDLHGSGI